MTQTSDVIVVGAGIAGVSAAARLADRLSVTVLEAEAHPGFHSTSRSAAIFVLNYGNATLRALNAASLPDLEGALLGETVLSPRGELLLASEEEMPMLTAHLEDMEGVERLSVAEACAMVPVLRPDRFVAAALERDAQDIDVDRLLQGALSQLRQQAGQVITNAPVRTAERRDGIWRVETGAGAFAAPYLVNAAGAWADDLARRAGVRPIGLRPMRRSAVVMPVPDDLSFQHWPMVGALREDWYAKPLATGLMISPAEEDPLEPQDAWPDDLVLAQGLDRFSQMVNLPLRRPLHSWAGLRSFVADRTPVCGFDPEKDGFFWLAGQGGYGVQTSPALSALTAALVFEDQPALSPEVVRALDPERIRSAADGAAPVA